MDWANALKLNERRSVVAARSFLALWLGLLLAGSVTADTNFIVGGALRDDNAAVYRSFIASIPSEGTVAILPTASGSPATSSKTFRANLTRYGLPDGRIIDVPVAVKDDRSTEDIDESEWARNAWDEDLVAKLQNAVAFWFTGGDQLRIIEALRDTQGNPSPLLQLIYQRIDAGAVVGGTSAGAAIMSETMITGGDSLNALLKPTVNAPTADESFGPSTLSLGTGLGFFKLGIVDQHFDRRARLGRLVKALIESGESRGWGIDENTALVVSRGTGQARVLGSGSVAVVDITDATHHEKGSGIIDNARVAIIPSGVSINAQTLVLSGDYGKPTVGHEYYNHAPIQGGGIALANSRLSQLLGYELLDNRGAEALFRPTVLMSGQGLLYAFSQDDASRGYWRSDGEHDRYTVTGVKLDISRIQFCVSCQRQNSDEPAMSVD